MKLSKPEADNLLAILEKFKGVPIMVIGDLIVDHYIWGRVDRISPEAPVVVVDATEESKRPGGAGNVANNLCSLDARVSICGVVGDDRTGRQLVSSMIDSGIDTSDLVVDKDRRTTLKTRVIAHAQQVVRVDHEDTHPLDDNQVSAIIGALESRLNSVKGVIVSDYAKGVVTKKLFDRFDAGRAKKEFSLDRLPIVVDPKDRNFAIYSGATVVKPNRVEAESASGIKIRNREDAKRAGDVLLERWDCDLVLITLGEDGMVLVGKDAGTEAIVEVNTVAREVYDVSGAGDTVSAVFSLALAVGASPSDAAVLSNIAAGIVVAEVGTVTVTRDEIADIIKGRVK